MSSNDASVPDANHSLSALFFEVHSGFRVAKKSLWIILPMTLVYSSFIALEPYFYKRFMDGIESVIRGTVSEALVRADLLQLAYLWGAFVLVSLVVAFIFRLTIWKTINLEWADVARRLAAKFLRIDHDYHVSVNIGERTKNYDRGPLSVAIIFEELYGTIVPQALIFLGLLALGFWASPMMMLVVLAFFPIIGVISVFVGKNVHAKQKRANELWDKTYGKFSDALQNISLVKLYARTEHEADGLASANVLAMSAQLKINILWGILNVWSGFIDFLAKIAVMIAGVFFVLSGKLSVGDLFLFVALAGRIFAPLQAIEGSYRNIVQKLADYAKMKAIFEREEERDTGTRTFPGISDSICFDHVRFSYPSADRLALDGVDFSIKKGARVAFVGHTGSGKTTLTQLLARFLLPTEWTVRVDGVDVQDFTLESYRSKFAAVFQETTMFNASIRQNLSYVRDGLSDEQIRNACRDANILEFIEGLEKGFDTEVGERGMKLSGGEKQRMAIARAILADPQILILDEATSALDAKTEHLVQQAFDRLMEGRTSIVIAHRLSTIRHADEIFLFEKGKLLDHGNHDALYFSSPVYREMVDFQKNGFLEESETAAA